MRSDSSGERRGSQDDRVHRRRTGAALRGVALKYAERSPSREGAARHRQVLADVADRRRSSARAVCSSSSTPRAQRDQAEPTRSTRCTRRRTSSSSPPQALQAAAVCYAGRSRAVRRDGTARSQCRRTGRDQPPASASADRDDAAVGFRRVRSSRRDARTSAASVSAVPRRCRHRCTLSWSALATRAIASRSRAGHRGGARALVLVEFSASRCCSDRELRPALQRRGRSSRARDAAHCGTSTPTTRRPTRSSRPARGRRPIDRSP